jgi:hypothetical protein
MRGSISTSNTTKELPELTSGEKNIPWMLRYKKLSFLAGACLSLSCVLIEAWTRVYPGSYFEADQELFRFRICLQGIFNSYLLFSRFSSLVFFEKRLFAF